VQSAKRAFGSRANARLVDRDDARVLERGGEPRLVEEAHPEALVLGQFGRDQLQRDRPPERQVGRSVDDAHPSAADHRLDLIAGEVRPGRPARRHMPTVPPAGERR
jgi:hypothetical protein